MTAKRNGRSADHGAPRRVRAVAIVTAWSLIAVLAGPTASAAPVPATTPATPRETPPATTAAADAAETVLEHSLGATAVVARRPGGGPVTLIAATPGHFLTAATDLDPVQAATTYLARYATLLGVRDAASELVLQSSSSPDGADTVVRFAQQRAGVPVLGAQVVVDVGPSGRVRSVSGRLSSAASTAAAGTVTRAARDQRGRSAARSLSLRATATDEGVSSAGLEAEASTAWVYDPQLLDRTAAPAAAVVWRTDPHDRLGDVARTVLVDASTGAVVLDAPATPRAESRRVCDDAGNPINPETCPTSGPLVARVEGQSPSLVQDVNMAYDLSGVVWSWYQTVLGRDSLDGAGMPLVSTVRYCETNNSSDCPYPGAYWNGSQMVYGASYANADDVVGHEFTHGFTALTSGLMYYAESGAINEAISDVIGELIDQSSTVSGPDLPANRWKIGEKLPGGAIRNMAAPTTMNQPDRMTSPFYSGSEADSHGVHVNSGVGDKAGYLIAAGTSGEPGGSFNGQIINGIGATKTALVFARAETALLVPSSDYADLFRILPQACNQILGTASITPADCTDVLKAVTATEMDEAPLSLGARLTAPACDAGRVPQATLFSDHMTDPSLFNWDRPVPAEPDNEGAQWISHVDDPNTGLRSLHTTNLAVSGVATAAQHSSVLVPAGAERAYLRFRHSFDMEADLTQSPPLYVDGGVVEFTTAGLSDTGWTDISALPTLNGYPAGAVITGTTVDNPLAGRAAFSGASPGWQETRVDISSLAGSTVRFRFRAGTDGYTAKEGWFVDDVEIYTCRTPTVPGAPQSVVATPANQAAVVSWAPPASDGGSPITSYVVTPYHNNVPLVPITTSDASTELSISGLLNGTSYTFKVAAVNGLGTGPASAASNSISPVPGSPGQMSAPTATRGDQLVHLSWNAPSDDGGSPILAYVITPYIGLTALASIDTNQSGLTYDVGSLTNGTAYTFRVAARNLVGTGAPSASSSAATPAGLPPPPANVGASAGHLAATVSWTAPVSNNGSVVTNYLVQPYAGATALTPFTTPDAVTSTTFHGLIDGQAYTFTVASISAVGTGAPSAASSPVVPDAFVPDAPTGVAAVAGDQSAVVSWSAPAFDGGAALVHYVVTPYAGATALTPITTADAGTSAAVPGLTNGTAYTFTVAASNHMGDSVASNPSAPVTPAGPPGPPGNVNAVAGDASATLTWTAPTSSNGSPITNYVITPFRQGMAQAPITTGTPALTATVNGLTNGVAYTFRVSTMNARGAGNPSSATAAVTPLGPPGRPTAVGGTRGDGTVSLHWTAPADTGGRPITSYTVTPYIDGVPQTSTTTPTSATSFGLAGLVNGTQYTFRVAGTSSVGTGAQSTDVAVLVPAGSPGPPTHVTTTPANAAILVAWTPPTVDGGIPITAYDVATFANGSPLPVQQVSGSTVSLVVRNLDRSTFYTFIVTARNDTGPGTPSQQTAPSQPSKVGFTPSGPDRVFDTRPGESPDARRQVSKVRVGGDQTLEVKVTDLVGLVPASGVGAVSLNVSVTNTSSAGFVTVYPCGPRKLVASVNYSSGQTVANAVIAPVSAAGTVCFYSLTPVDLIVDLNGWFAADSGYAAVGPDRVFDTRDGESPTARRTVDKVKIGGDRVLTVQMTGLAGLVPADDVAAVSLNVAVTNPSGSGFVTVFPCGERPQVASVNFRAGQTVANAVIAPVSSAGTVCFYSLVPVDLIVDINGWFARGSDFTTAGPDRMFDTRSGESPLARVNVTKSQVGGEHVLQTVVIGLDGLTPTSGVGALSLNVVATGAAASGFVTVYPCGERKLVASVNYGAGETVANAVLAPVSPTGTLCFYSLTPVDLIVDVNGWFPTAG